MIGKRDGLIVRWMEGRMDRRRSEWMKRWMKEEMDG